MRRSLQALVLLLGIAQAASAQTDDIRALKAEVKQLQERVNQLSPPPSDSTGGVPPLPPVFPCNAGRQLQADPSSFCLPSAACSKAEGGADWPLSAYWKDGLQIKSSDDAFRVHVGGNIQFDYGWNAASQAVQFGPGGTGELADGAVFRRARIRMDGTLYQHFEWVTEFDFANNVNNDTSSSPTPIGSPSFTNVWFGANDLPLIGTLRAGWMDEPIGFAHLSSNRWLNFMETAPGVGALSLTSPGVLLMNATKGERLTWAFGFFHAQNNNFGFGFGDGQYAGTGRLTWLPWYEDDGAQLVHLGVGATTRRLNNNDVELRGRPSVRTMPGVLEPTLADTGSITAPREDAVDVELAGVFGPWTLQSEYAALFIHDAVSGGTPRGTLFYQGAYVELLYFLTGETRAYDRRNAVFDRVIPRRNFNIWSGERGPGAWQVGIRYGYLDLQNKGVNGATLHDIVLGLNWFLNPNAKFQWNLAIDHRGPTPPGSSGWTYIFGGRLALDF
jgi:phosphate-selective porin OprO/OprP